MVVDPGMVPGRSAILDPLRELGVEPAQVTDVVLSHHHPDHTVNIALFPEDVRIHDHWAVYQRDVWSARAAEGVELTADVRLLETPGHTPQDISTVVDTGEGTVVLTHLWWSGDIAPDPKAVDGDAVRRNRERVLELATLIVPGHGPAFAATEAPVWTP
ncbi:MAG: MBL fold metallo-hydrolase [Actinobacteria bacterium]|nr:MBL fold metallo-hydrolase [Actinomycetota bacterium]